MDGWPVIALTVASAAGFAVSSALKHRSADDSPAATDLGARNLGRLIRLTVSHRLWLAGIAADVVALSLQIVALHLGSLALVQPLLVCSLVFALLLRGGLGRRELAWALLLCLSLVGFVSLSGTATASGAVPDTDRLPAVLAGVAGAVVVAGLLGWGRADRTRKPATVYGIAVGVLYAATAALLKGLTDRAVSHGLLGVLEAWQLYTLLVCGAAGMLLNQIAFQAGPLSASLPATTAVDPLASIVIGVAVFDEHIRRGVASGVGLALLLALLVVCVLQLARRAGEPARAPAAVGVG